MNQKISLQNHSFSRYFYATGEKKADQNFGTEYNLEINSFEQLLTAFISDERIIFYYLTKIICSSPPKLFGGWATYTRPALFC